MAKKEAPISMVDSFAEFKELKNIDKTTMISVLEESFRNVLAKMFGSDENFVVIMNPDKGDCEIYQNLEVVADGAVEKPSMQIALSEAREIDPECEIGEEVTKEINFEKFGRRAILTLRQTLASKILDLQKDAIYNKFKAMEGEIVTGEVYQVWKREVLVLDEDHNEQHNGHRTRTSSVILPTENRFYASAVKIEPKECREIDVTGYYSWNKVLIVEQDQLKRHSWDEICEKRLYKLMSREKARWNDGYYIITYTGYDY